MALQQFSRNSLAFLLFALFNSKESALNYLLNINKRDADVSSKIILRDEAYIHLVGCVNRQNCCFWGSEKPQLNAEKRMKSQRVNVWWGFWAGSIISHALQPVKQLNYRMRHLHAMYSLVSAIRSGPLDRLIQYHLISFSRVV